MSAVEASAPNTADVTVIVTSYNHQAYLEQCLDSIAAQTVRPAQVIVIDDNSTDDSANLIEHWLRETSHDYSFLHHARNIGLNASLNEGLALAEGAYLIHVSGDDWVEPDRVERQVATMNNADPITALIVGDIREVNAGGATLVEHDFGTRLSGMTGLDGQPKLLGGLLAENNIPAPGVLMRTSAVREVGGFDEELAFEDYDLWLRLSTRHAIDHAPGIVSSYRIVDSGLTRNTSRRSSMLRSEAEMLAKHIGSSAENNETIRHRLIAIDGAILDLGSVADFRRVLELAIAASNEDWLKKLNREASRRGGLQRIRARFAAEFGLPVQTAARSPH